MFFLIGLLIFLAILFILIILTLMYRRNNKDDFVNTIKRVHLPILKKVGLNYKISEYNARKIYDLNKEQINCVFNNINTRNLFKDQINFMNCAHNNLVKAVLQIYILKLNNINKDISSEEENPQLSKSTIMIISLIFSHIVNHSKSEISDKTQMLCQLLRCGPNALFIIRNNTDLSNCKSNQPISIDCINHYFKNYNITASRLFDYLTKYTYFNTNEIPSIIALLSNIANSISQEQCVKYRSSSDSVNNAVSSLITRVFESYADIVI